MRLLRWAVDLAVDTRDPWRSAAGMDVLDALSQSKLLQTEDVELVRRVTSSIASTMVTALEQQEEYRQEEDEPEGDDA